MSEQNDNINEFQKKLREEVSAGYDILEESADKRLESSKPKVLPGAVFNILMFGFAVAWLESILGKAVFDAYPNSTTVYILWTIFCIGAGLFLYYGARWLWFKQTGSKAVEEAAQKHSQEFINNIYKSLLGGTPEEQRVALIILDVIDPSPKK